MRWKVQLPDYPCHHIVTGLSTTRGASGKRLLVAEAQSVREGFREPFRCSDLVTLMLLHDAIVAKTPGPLTANRQQLYGRTKELQGRAVSRIAGAVVERLED